jgi:Pvc16 N-terminal domain
MSNSLAVAATTATLRNLLLSEVPKADADLADLEVTTQPLDAARKGITKAQLNLFLYQTVTNAAWRNLDVPGPVRPGETGSPPLALNLHYLITTYGRGEADNHAVSHRVLGAAMSVLHDHPVLSRAEISAALAGNDLADQFERLKVTPLPMTIEDISKLWMVFMTQYRISAAYEVTVVLIDSKTPARSPLPVLTRGKAGRGWPATASVAPVLTEVRPARSQQAARLGEDVVVAGARLTSGAAVRFTSTRVPHSVELPASAGGTASEITVHLPDKAHDSSALSRWAPGLYTVALVIRDGGAPVMTSNEVALALAPLTTVTPTRATHGTITLRITCEPRIVPGQRVLLVFGDRQAQAASMTTPPDPAQPTTLTFTLHGITAGRYLVRLRVDGVDSIPVVYTGSPPVPGFDPNQTVEVV